MIDKLYSKLDTNGSPVLITSLDNIFYVSGFSTAARRYGQIGYTAVILRQDEITLYVPEKWRSFALEHTEADVKIEAYSGDIEVLADAVAESLVADREIAYELDGIDAHFLTALRRRIPRCTMTDISHKFRLIRLKKSDKELALIRKSAALVSRAMDYAKDILVPGKTEWEIMAELEWIMRKNGSSGTPFTMKVLCGENAVRTINLPGDNVIHKGEIVLIDMGCTLNGYSSDWTRSFAVGMASDDQKCLYTLVDEIKSRCINEIKPGVSAKHLMNTALAVTREHKFEKFFNPFLGHSLGINSQEWPNLDAACDIVLEENMVITIEPGVYVPGIGGVRLEDEVIVTSQGHEVLTGLTHEEFVISH